MSGNVKKNKITIQEVYPQFTPQEQAEAEYNLRQYALLIWSIYQRIRRENPNLLTDILKKDRV